MKDSMRMSKDNRLSTNQKRKFVEILFYRFQQNRTTPKENLVMNEVESMYLSQDEKIVSDEIIEKAEARQRLILSKKLGFSVKPKKNILLFRSLKYAGVLVAASVLAFVLFNTAIQKKDLQMPEQITTSGLISKQFVAHDTMKKVTLSDGSTIYMNMGTTISLREGHFNEISREVWLEDGEAFFEIAKDPDRPFIVHTPGDLQTKVLGTSFNIKAYMALGQQIVSVNTGKVQVSDSYKNEIFLLPNEKVTYDNINGGLLSDKVDAVSLADWRTGHVILENANIKEVAFRLKQVFDVDLYYSGVISENEKIYTSFSSSSSLDEVLNILCELYGAQYKTQNDTIVLIR